MISQYFINFGNIVNEFDFVVKSEIQIRKINDFLGIIEGKLSFDNSFLDILEVIRFTDNQIIKTKYKYHLQTNDGKMIFRYDNAPHHQNVATYPHHKHIGTEITESNEPELELILSEIRNFLR